MPGPRPLRAGDPDRLGGHRLTGLLGEDGHWPPRSDRPLLHRADHQAPDTVHRERVRRGPSAARAHGTSAGCTPGPSSRTRARRGRRGGSSTRHVRGAVQGRRPQPLHGGPHTRRPYGGLPSAEAARRFRPPGRAAADGAGSGRQGHRHRSETCTAGAPCRTRSTARPPRRRPAEHRRPSPPRTWRRRSSWGRERFDLYPADAAKAKREPVSCGMPTGFSTRIAIRKDRPGDKALADAVQQALARAGISVRAAGPRTGRPGRGSPRGWTVR
jgi:hypothetical protein